MPAHREWAVLWRFQARHLGGDGEGRPDGPLRIVLMRAWPAEIGEHAIAQELREMALIAADLARDHVLEVAHHVARLLRIEPCGERGGPDEVDEQYAQPAAFDPTLDLRFAVMQCQEQAASLAQTEPDLLEIAARQLGQESEIDVVGTQLAREPIKAVPL